LDAAGGTLRAGRRCGVLLAGGRRGADPPKRDLSVRRGLCHSGDLDCFGPHFISPVCWPDEQPGAPQEPQSPQPVQDDVRSQPADCVRPRCGVSLGRCDGLRGSDPQSDHRIVDPPGNRRRTHRATAHPCRVSARPAQPRLSRRRLVAHIPGSRGTDDFTQPFQPSDEEGLRTFLLGTPEWPRFANSSLRSSVQAEFG
jgi:hypothetical protein